MGQVMTFCHGCGTLIPSSTKGGRCPKCAKKLNKEKYQQHKNHTGEDLYKMYASARWKKFRDKIFKKHHNMCVISYVRDGKIVPAEILHHIELANKDNFWNEDNVIPLSKEVHQALHGFQNSNYNYIRMLECEEYLKEFKLKMGIE